MKIITSLVVGLDIKDCIGVCANDEAIMGILVNKYESKCYMGMFIEKVNSVKVQGECIINQHGAPTFGTMSIICEVTAIKYPAGEVINGCVVENKDKSGVIICGTNIAKIMLASHPSFESVTKGQIISVRVGSTKYWPGANMISVNAIPYLPSVKFSVYKLDVAANDKLLLDDVLARIEYEEAQAKDIKKTNVKAWDFFDQLLYAYASGQKAPKGATEVNINELLKPTGKARYVSRDPRINLSLPIVYEYKEADADSIVGSGNVLVAIFEDYCSHLRTIRELIDVYSTGELITAHKNLWQIFKKNKVTA